MAKKTTVFESKTTEDMYKNLPGSDEEKEDVAATPSTTRRVQRLDPSGPFVGKLTRDRVLSMVSNVDMEDVSGDPRVANAPALPKHPVFSGSTTKEKREFIQKYNLYYSTLLSYETSYNRPFVMPVSACIDPWMKEHLARFEFARPLDQITETDWIDFFRESLISDRTDLSPIDAEMAKLRLDLKHADAPSMMTDLVVKIYKKLEEHGLVAYVETADPKRIVTWMVKALEPPVFKQRIEDKLRLEINKSYKKDPVAARRWIAEDLKYFLEYSTEWKTPKTKDPSQREPTPTTKRDPGRDPKKKKKKTKTDADAGDDEEESKTPQRFACLKCGSTEHAVRRCPKLKDGEAEKLLEELRKKRDTPGRSNRQIRTAEAPNSGIVRATLEDCCDVEALLDSGADCALITRKLVDRLAKKKAFLKTHVLEEPERIGTAGPAELVVKRKVYLESVVFHTSAGQLRWRNVECVVDEESESELLVIDRPTMEKMGYSADGLLVAAKRQMEEKSAMEREVMDETRAREPEKPFIRRLQLEKTALCTPDGYEEPNSLEETLWTPEVHGIEEQREQIEALLHQKIEAAVANGLSEIGTERLRVMLRERKAVFRVEFANDEPVKVTPMKVKLKEGAEPVMCRSRRYPPLHRDYMKKHMEELEANGLVFKNPDARWGSAPRIVPKKEPGEFRMTVDLRGVNAVTNARTWPMPYFDTILSHVEGSKCFFSLDCFRFYWQLPCDAESCEYFTFVTPSGLWTPTRVIMGATDAVAFCQQAIEEALKPVLDRGVQVWLDDVLGYALTEEELLQVLEIVLARCEEYGIKLHPGKCDFFLRMVTWCGRVLSGGGVSHCPSRVQGLVDLQSPTTAGELQQFLCAVNWMRESIPEYNKLVQELTELVEQCMAKCGSRKKTKLTKIALSECGWSEIHERALERVKSALKAMVPMAHPKDDQDICVYTDASQDHWGAVITQVVPGELSKPLSDQQHQPLAFLSGSFKGSSSRWPIVEKEAFAIVETCKRMEYLLLRNRGFHLFTDHRNLQYIFDPTSVDSNIARYQADKLQRWSMVLASFKYEIEFVSGEDNVWGDLLSRWGAPATTPATKKICQLVVVDQVSPLQDPEFVWPSWDEIASSQAEHLVGHEGLERDSVSGCWKDRKDRVVIPDQALEIKKRLCIVSHAGAAGHRGMNATLKTLQEVFTWRGMQKDVQAFIRDCLHCMAVGTKKVPRPLGETLKATRPNEVLHFDFLTLPKATDGYKYVLVLKDGMSGFVELIPSTRCTADVVIAGLTDWFKRFGPVRQWVSDQGAHFKNQVVTALAKAWGTDHHFVTAYCPWANGTVEVVNRMLLRVLKSMLSERKLKTNQWPTMLPMVQAALDLHPSSRLNGVAPVTAFAALTAKTPVQMYYATQAGADLPAVTPVEYTAAVQDQLVQLQVSVHQLHEKLTAVSAERTAVSRSSSKSPPFPNFDVGDFVLVGRVLARPNKLALEWLGPCRIVQARSHWLYEVQTLFEPVTTTTHHISRLKLYAEASRAKIDDLRRHAVAHQDVFLVDRLLECRPRNSSFEILVQWQGFDRAESTWEPLEALQADVPNLVTTALTTLPHPSFQDLKTFLAGPLTPEENM